MAANKPFRYLESCVSPKSGPEIHTDSAFSLIGRVNLVSEAETSMPVEFVDRGDC